MKTKNCLLFVCEVPRLSFVFTFWDSRTLTTLWKQIHEEDQRILDIITVHKKFYNLHLAVPKLLLGTLALVLEVGMPSVQTSSFLVYYVIKSLNLLILNDNKMFKGMLLVNPFYFLSFHLFTFLLPFIGGWLPGQAKLITALLFLED